MVQVDEGSAEDLLSDPGSLHARFEILSELLTRMDVVPEVPHLIGVPRDILAEYSERAAHGDQLGEGPLINRLQGAVPSRRTRRGGAALHAEIRSG